MDERFIQHQHAPPHLFRPGATYCVTGKALEGQPVMSQPARRNQFIESLHFAAEQRKWDVIAWVALSNHYHCLLRAPEAGADSLSRLINSLHRYTAREWNRADGVLGRTVWYQYWDTCITHEASFLARLNYIHHNPVRHGLVASPEEYPHSSYRRWMEAEDLDLPGIEAFYPWDRIDLE